MNRSSERYTKSQNLAVYLSGPITGLTYEGAADWREYFKDLVPHHLCSSPMRLKDHLIGEGPIGDHSHAAAVLDDRAVVSRDRWDVQNSDVMVVNLAGAERVSIGTMIEYGWADAYDTFVVTVSERVGPDGGPFVLAGPHNHMFIEQLSAVVVPSLDAAAEVVNAL